MPPRASTRTTRKPSVEPTNKPPVAKRETTARKVSASKRKREDPDPNPDPLEVDEDENDDSDADTRLKKTNNRTRQPSSRSRQVSSGSAKGKEKSRRAASTAPTQGDEDDDDDAPSPPKRSRVNTPVSLEEGSVEDGESSVAPKERRRASSKPASRSTKQATKSSRKVVREEESDEEQDADESPYEEERPKPKSRKASSKPPSRASSVGKSSKTTKSAAKVDVKVKVEPTIEESEGEDEDLLESLAASKSASKSTKVSDKNVPTVEEAAESDNEPEKSLLDNAPTTANVRPRHSIAPLPPVVEEPEGPKARLVIHKLVLVNFKSYAGRQVIGPFHKSFSAIVGPNGSGKSNTIDSLLFVFGYRATKMRQGKLSELIHNSANYPDLDECSVEVHFREIIDLPGPDAFEIMPNSDIVVARHAYKSNSSKYTINDRLSSFTEVTTLLKGRGIDLDHKRFLILQGEVESIAQMKPKAPTEHEDGLLEYLEDIIGTDRFKAPIEEAMKELDGLGDLRAEKLGRLRIVEREKNALEEKKREADEFLRMQNELVRAQSRLYQWYLWRCFDAEAEYAEAMGLLEQELAEETERNKDDITHCDNLQKHFDERGKAYEEVKAAAQEATKELAVCEKQQVDLEERRKHANTKATKLKKSMKDDQKGRDEAARTMESNREKLEKEKGKLDDYEEELKVAEKELERIQESLKDKTQVFHDQIEAKQKELQPWTAKIDAKNAELDMAISERDTLSKKAETVKKTYDEALETLEQLRNDLRDKESRKEDLNKNRVALNREVTANDRTVEELRGTVAELRSKASSFRQRIDEAKASQAASTSQNKVLDGLTRLSATGRISGFHGKLGLLGTIPEKYDVAISTAAPSLNNMLVDNVEEGQACIEYLRKQNLGRASFFVLEKLQNLGGMEKTSTPENVPRLFDLIKPKDERFRPAFYKAVGNTLVANDLDQANRIAFTGSKRYRVVTLTGQLIDTSGTMSGGGTHVSRGLMSAKLAPDVVKPEVLRRYEKDSEEATLQLNDAIAKLRDCEQQAENRSRKIPEIEMELRKIDLDLQNASKRISEAERRVRDLKSKNKPDEGDLARISALDSQIAASGQALEKLKDKSGVIEKAIKDLEKKILDIGGAKLLTQKSKVDGIKLHMNLAMEEITKAEVNIAKAEKDINRFSKNLDTNTSTLQEIEADLEELDEKLGDCNEFVAEMKSKVEAAQSAAENAKDDLDNLKAELDEKMEQIQKFRAREMEITQKLNDVKKEAKENEKHITHYQAEHDKLKLEDVDEDDEEEEEAQNTAKEGTAESAQGDESARPSVEPMSEDGERTPVKPEPTEENLALPSKTHHPSHELYSYNSDELSRFKKKELLADVALLDEQVKNANPNLSVLKEYRKREQEFLSRAKDLEEVTKRRDAQKTTYDGLRKQRLDEFMTGFNLISAKLKEMYQMITLGGNAELELVDSMDPFSEGIIFSVMPPKKSWKNISNLSGGEKTLSSLALVFALHVFKPTPLYFMDEIDAALDFRNVSIVANYIKDRTKNAQFIIISLRNDMFELSHRLIGIYKTSNATRSISINNHALLAAPRAVNVPSQVASTRKSVGPSFAAPSASMLA